MCIHTVVALAACVGQIGSLCTYVRTYLWNTLILTMYAHTYVHMDVCMYVQTYV